jgi:hypothetical protein
MDKYRVNDVRQRSASDSVARRDRMSDAVAAGENVVSSPPTADAMRSGSDPGRQQRCGLHEV